MFNLKLKLPSIDTTLYTILIAGISFIAASILLLVIAMLST